MMGGKFFKKNLKKNYLHPIPGWDIPIHPIPGWGEIFFLKKNKIFLFTSHPRMGHPKTSHPRMGHYLHPIPGWAIIYIPSQDGTSQYIPSQDGGKFF